MQGPTAFIIYLGQDVVEKKTKQPSDLLCRHLLKCHGDHDLNSYLYPGHDPILRILSLSSSKASFHLVPLSLVSPELVLSSGIDLALMFIE